MKHISEEQLQMAADGVTLFSGAEQQHLQECRRCHESYAFYQKLATSLAAEEIPELSASFEESVMERLPEPATAYFREWANYTLLGIATLTGVALTVFFAGSYLVAGASALFIVLQPLAGTMPVLIALGVILLVVALLEQSGHKLMHEGSLKFRI
ncbi:MAG: hypothetical protein WD077_06615 [Bacteroidia bacterium]